MDGTTFEKVHHHREVWRSPGHPAILLCSHAPFGSDDEFPATKEAVEKALTASPANYYSVINT